MSQGEFAAGRPPGQVQPGRCPYCDAELRPGARRCWLCEEELPATAGDARADHARAARIEAASERIALPQPRRDNPAMAFLGLLAILICVGLAAAAPGLLIVLLIVATPAFIRTMVVSSRRQAEGIPATGLGAVGTFLSSVAVAALIGIATVGAFLASCFAVCFGGLALNDLSRGRGNWEWVMVASIGAGLVSAGLVFALIMRRIWKKRT
jgi:hypothetical protein